MLTNQNTNCLFVFFFYSLILLNYIKTLQVFSLRGKMEAFVTIRRGPRTKICCAVETDSSKKGFNTCRPLQYCDGSTHFIHNKDQRRPLVLAVRGICTSYINWRSNYHFKVALSFTGLVSAKSKFAVNVQLTHVRVVLGNLSTEPECEMDFQRETHKAQLTWKLKPPSNSPRSVGRICTDKSAGQVLRMRSRRAG